MNTPDEALASALGAPLFTTDLCLPRYQASEQGEWRLAHHPCGLDRGYHSGLWLVREMPVLLRRTPEGTWQTWMSLSAHEIESQELGCRHAFGTTVVMGLGMGWVAINAAQRAEVGRVIVVERDPAVIELFRRVVVLPTAAQAKIELIEADALTWRPPAPVDFLYADIWRTLAEPQTVSEVRRMQANVQARWVYFWGQEIALYAQVEPWLAGGEKLTMELLRRCADERLGLPLLLPEAVDYPELIMRVISNRRARGLPVR